MATLPLSSTYSTPSGSLEPRPKSMIDFTRPAPPVRHLYVPPPLHFPEEELMPEGKAHLIVRTFLYQLLQYALGPDHSVGSEQFIYWNARDTQIKLAPDAFVCLDVPDSVFGSWKTWERGTPDLAIEIVSPNEGDGITWDDKLARYHEMGIRELVRFDPEASEGSRLRVWDRVNEHLVERVVEEDATPCLTLRPRAETRRAFWREGIDAIVNV